MNYAKLTLQLPEVMHHIDAKPLVVSRVDGVAGILRASERTRKNLTAGLIPKMHRAEKFLFDSGSDQDERTVSAVRETAVNMMEAGLFHLPFPLIWVEDPYEDNPETMRNFYLAEEVGSKITLRFIQRFNPKEHLGLPPEAVGNFPSFLLHADTMVIDLSKPQDTFEVLGVDKADPTGAKILGEAVYALKKFVVTLATEQAIKERHEPPAGTRQGGDKRSRGYPHTVVRVPYDTSEAEGDWAGPSRGTQGKRRLHLVRGYTYGKNTKPLYEQKWVKPYWRGDASLGLAERGHYKVG